MSDPISTIGVAQASDFIPEIWANTALEILRANIAVAPRVYRDTDVASFTVGDHLHIPYPGTLAANEKVAGTQYVLSQPAGAADVDVTLDSHPAVSFIIEDITRAQANQDLIRNYSEVAAIELAETIEADLLATISATSKTSGTYGTNLTFAAFAGAWKTMTDNKCPASQRYAAVSTKDMVSLVSDDKVAALLAFSRGGQIASDPNNLGAIAGFQEVLASQLIPTAGTSIAVQTKNVAWRRDGVILAMRGLPDPPAGTGAVASSVRDDISGIVLRAVMAYDAAYGGVRVTLECLYGTKILREEKTLLLKS